MPPRIELARRILTLSDRWAINAGCSDPDMERSPSIEHARASVKRQRERQALRGSSER
jgi:hypothetical protein